MGSCDVLVHAHDQDECEDLFKLRLIADQSHASLLVLHSGKMMECYGRRHAEAKKAGLMPLSDEDMQPHHSIPLNSGAEAHFQRAALSSLARNALLARLRYWHSMMMAPLRASGPDSSARTPATTSWWSF